MSEVGNKILTGESDGFGGDLIDDKSANAFVDTSPKYFFIFLVLATFSALLIGWQLKLLNSDPGVGNLINTALSVILFTFFTVFIPWFIRSIVYAAIFAIFSGLALITFFANIFSVWIFIGVLAYAGFFLIAFYRARETLDNWLLVKFASTTMVFAKPFLAGLAIFLALLYGGLYAQDNKISMSTHELLLASASPTISLFFPEFNLNSTVDETLTIVAQKQLGKLNGFSILGQAEKNIALDQVTLELRNKIIDLTNQPILNTDTILDYTYNVLTKFTLSTAKNDSLAILIVIIVSAIALGIIKLIFAILRWPIVICATIMYYMLRSVEIIKLTTEKRNKEIILLR